MEEQKKREQDEIKADETKEMEEKGAGNEENTPQEPAGLPTRSMMLLVLAGIYLLYTGYRLCKNVMDGVEGASMGFMLAGIAFLIIGAGMLFVGLRGVYKSDRLKKAQEAAEARLEAEKQAAGEKAADEQAAEEQKKMTLSERASLTNRLEDEETEQEEK